MSIFKDLNREDINIIIFIHKSSISQHAKRTILFKDGIVEDQIIVGRQYYGTSIRNNYFSI